jgi:hypothetical protein
MNVFSIKVQEFTHPYVKYTVKYNDKLCEIVDVKTISPKSSIQSHIKGDFLRMVIYNFVVIKEDIDINLLHIGENINTGNRTVVSYRYKCESKSIVLLQDVAKPPKDPFYVLLASDDIVNMYRNIRSTNAAIIKEPIPDAPIESNDKPFLTKDNYGRHVRIKDENASSTFGTRPPTNRIIMPNDNDVYAGRSIDRYYKNREPKTASCCVIS